MMTKPIPPLKPRRKPDDGLRPIMRDGLRTHGFWITTVETGEVTQGVPDINYLTRNNRGVAIEGWVECKATSAWAVVMRPMQIGWHMRRAHMGGRSWIAVRRRNRTVDQLWLVRGRDVAKLLERGGLQKVGGLLGDDGPNHWDWESVALFLEE
jgi:hypothetical protein